MSTSKNLGIWMDHANAHVMEFGKDPITTVIISSRFTHQEKEHVLGKSENGMHQKEQHEKSAYYKKLADLIKAYHDVLLFGPSTAKVELLHLLRADHQFEKITLHTKDADKMTQNEQHAFVRDYFSHRL
jgi:Lhr-like helicase